MSDFPEAYWSEWSELIKTKYSLKQTTKGEWHGPCPCCCGTDRFWIKNHNGIVKAFCRQGCEFKDMVAEMRHDGVWPDKQDNVITLREASVSLGELLRDDDTPQFYHERKGVELFGSKLSGDNVVVQLFNTDKQRVGTQTISPSGKKKFNAGLDKSSGCFGVVGKLTGVGLAYVAEGWATSASVYAATGTTCIFALDSGHMPVAVEAIEKEWPELELVIAADNDEAGIRAAKATGKRWAVPSGEGQDWNDVHAALGVVAVMEGLQRAKVSDGLFTHVGDLRMKPAQWLIDGMLEKEALIMAFGNSGAGKTFAVLDMALCVAAGKDWHGKQVEQGLCLYIAGEGHAGMARRVAAWAKVNDTDLSEVPFYKSNSTIIMNEEADAQTLADEISKMAEKVGKPTLVVLDTLARTMAGDENSSERVGEYIKACDKIKQEWGCSVLVVHHTGHSNKQRARGSSSFYGALDAEFKVAAWGDNKLLIESTKMKDAEPPDAMAFVKLPVSLMTDEGDETGSLALELTEDKPVDKASPENIQSVVVDQVRTVDAFGEAPRSELKEAVSLELECSQRTANRHIKKLIDKGVLALRGGKVVVA